MPATTWRTEVGKVTARAVVLASADLGLRERLKRELVGMRWNVLEAGGGAEAMGQVERGRPEALVVDGWLPDLEVSEFVWQMGAMYPGMDVVRMDGGVGSGARSSRRNELLHAIREGQDEVGKFVQEKMVEAKVMAAVLALPLVAALIPELVGDSGTMVELARLIRLVAPRSATVLIEGETGTGKEVVAKALHRLSARAGKAFAVLNCAAIPEALLEAELFGHTRGAFTGAVTSRMGRIEAADGGTLFLDEIGEMPLALQAKLLRFLDCGEIQKVGENETMRVDVRVIAATHELLEQRAEAGTFRLDLYHRLAVFPVEISALRDRLSDLPLLVEFFLEKLGKEGPRKSISAAAMAKLKEHEWPGNVRELMHVLERGAILVGDRPEIGVDEVTLRSSRRR